MGINLHDLWYNFTHNLFKPLLLFFYLGFSVPIIKVAFEFPYVLYQGLTIYLLVSIGWHGGEELASLPAAELKQALGFMIVGFLMNFAIGIFAYLPLRLLTKLRRVDAATVAAYYGSDSAGTFVTCVGVLGGLQILALSTFLESGHLRAADLGIKELNLANVTDVLNDKDSVKRLEGKGIDVAQLKKAQAESEQYKPAAYMPVMLAIMEIPGCLVGLFLVSRLRHTGMDALGNMPDEPGYNPHARPSAPIASAHGGGQASTAEVDVEDGNGGENSPKAPPGLLSAKLLHEVFLNPGLFLLFGGIFIGFVSRYQGKVVTDPDDPLFNTLFQGLLCLFLLEMGMTASKRLKDLKSGGIGFILYALIAPNVYATAGMLVAHAYSHVSGAPFSIGTYVLFAVLCGAASYIAVPAVQRMAIPEASPTLPLAASLGLTFSYNVTIGIPVYIEIAKAINSMFPVASAVT